MTTLCFSAKGEGLLLPLSRVDVLAYGLVVKRCAVCVWFSHCAGRANPYDHQTPGTLSSIAIALASLTRTSTALRKSVACAGHPQRQGLHTLTRSSSTNFGLSLGKSTPSQCPAHSSFPSHKDHGYPLPLSPPISTSSNLFSLLQSRSQTHSSTAENDPVTKMPCLQQAT